MDTAVAMVALCTKVTSDLMQYEPVDRFNRALDLDNTYSRISNTTLMYSRN